MSFTLQSILGPSSGQYPERHPPQWPNKTSTSHSSTSQKQRQRQSHDDNAADRTQQQQQEQQRHFNIDYEQNYNNYLNARRNFDQVPPTSSYQCPHSTTYSGTEYGRSSMLHHFASNTNLVPPAQSAVNPQRHNHNHNRSHNHNHNHIHTHTHTQNSRPSHDDQNWGSHNFSEEDYSSEPYSEFTLDSPLPNGEEQDQEAHEDTHAHDEGDGSNNSPYSSDADPEEESLSYFGYGRSFLSNFIDPQDQHQTQHRNHFEPQDQHQTQQRNHLQPSYNSAHPLSNVMSPPLTRKRSSVHLDLDSGPSTAPPATKRRRTSGSRAATSHRAPVKHTRSIEEVDLTAEDDPLNATLQKQRADAVIAQQQQTNGGSNNNKSKLSTLQCTVCLDTPEDLTATACGHTFCRSCLMNWLIAGEKEPTRRPNCPACRKVLKRSAKNDTIPLEIMKRPVR